MEILVNNLHKKCLLLSGNIISKNTKHGSHNDEEDESIPDFNIVQAGLTELPKYLRKGVGKNFQKLKSTKNIIKNAEVTSVAGVKKEVSSKKA